MNDQTRKEDKDFIKENKVFQCRSKQIKEIQTFWKSFYKEAEIKVLKEGQDETEIAQRQELLKNAQKWETFKRNRAIIIDLYLELKKR